MSGRQHRPLVDPHEKGAHDEGNQRDAATVRPVDADRASLAGVAPSRWSLELRAGQDRVGRGPAGRPL
jgi:hypothetical protein